LFSIEKPDFKNQIFNAYKMFDIQFNYGELPLKINDSHICENHFHDNHIDLYIFFKTKTLGQFSKIKKKKNQKSKQPLCLLI
jgi:hypothetical protein